MFGRCGATVFNADRIAHRALFRNTSSYRKLITRFGKVILNKRGGIDREKLAAIGFADARNERDMCAIIHPQVFAYLRRNIRMCRKKNPRRAIVVEAPLLIESGLFRSMDTVIVVRAGLPQQRRRAAERSMSVEQFRRRVRFQMPLREKITYADYVIDNRGTLKYTERQVRDISKQLNIRKVYGNKH